MHLPRPFFRIPRRFDVDRLRAEVAALPESAWAPHPNGIPGNYSCRLISADGGENDRVEGNMRATPSLERSPYIRQVLASFGVPWSRSRLMRLAPRVGVPEHSDINYHWYYRVRVHIPVFTRPEVLFHCDGERVHMASGEAWVFDNWRQHHVEHTTPDERIHLVADTAGTSAFWQLVASGEDPAVPVVQVPYDPARTSPLLFERATQRPVMNPAELEMLVGNLRGDLVASQDAPDVRARFGRYHGLLDSFVRDWRGLYSLYGEERDGWVEFAKLRDSVRPISKSLGDGIVLRANRVAAHQVLEARVLRACLSPEAEASLAESAPGTAGAGSASPAKRRNAALLSRPVFIVAAPRSGSTLLFETLAASRNVATLGGEAHWLVESIPELCPGAPSIDSNRLEARHASRAVADRIREQVLARAVDADGAPVGDEALRFVEKTPKNALRVPFLNAIFPDARFVFLWREPRGNLSSIIDAWRSGRWRTYPRLEGFDPPWSLLLPPGWAALRGRPVEEIAAFQWQVTNDTLLRDLGAIDPERWVSVDYGRLTADPDTTVRGLAAALGIEVDEALHRRLTGGLPLARHTLTAPDSDKWRRNEAEIERVLAGLTPTWDALRGLRGAGDQSPNR